MSEKKVDKRAAALALVAQVERQGGDIARSYNNGAGITDRFGDFRSFIEKLDHFQVFVDLVETRLGDFEPEKQAAQAHNLAAIRCSVLMLEVAATRVFLQRYNDSGKPWPLGSKPFLSRRHERLAEITTFHAQASAEHQLPALDTALFHDVGQMLQVQLGLSAGLDDFSVASAAFAPLPLQSLAEPPSRAAARPAPRVAPITAPIAKRQLKVRQDDGNYYVEADGMVAVSEACRGAHLSLDDLADKMNVSRPTLVLMLNGRDPITLPALNQLRAFMARYGGAAA